MGRSCRNISDGPKVAPVPDEIRAIRPGGCSEEGAGPSCRSGGRGASLPLAAFRQMGTCVCFQDQNVLSTTPRGSSQPRRQGRQPRQSASASAAQGSALFALPPAKSRFFLKGQAQGEKSGENAAAPPHGGIFPLHRAHVGKGGFTARALLRAEPNPAFRAADPAPSAHTRPGLRDRAAKIRTWPRPPRARR